ncbi:hypothetical protein U9M48_030936 [Paspalum notatum var. saurae]|uniref:Reverse transcriptase domain-containing protein n=1 Tax=Paspalum notatum var. saurae TaxID=547442 RepID=A0AAQ3U203_PASNO
MDPNFKLLFDEMKAMRGSVDDLNDSLTARISGVEKSLGDRFANLESAAAAFEVWKPSVGSSVEELRQEVGVLRKAVNRVVLDSAPPSAAGIFTKPALATASQAAGNPADGPDGHRVDQKLRKPVFGKEEVTGASCKDSRRPDAYSNFKPVGPYPLPLLPPKVDAVASTSWAEDRRSLDASHIRASHDKMAALRAYIRAQGLCQRCAEKWSRDHKCPPSVQLHVLQEVWDLFQFEDDQLSQPADQPSEQDSQLFVTKVLKGHAPCISKADSLIVITHTFVSSRVLADIPGICPLSSPIPVQVANGSRMQCSAQVLDVEWSVQACCFTSNLKILELINFDMIVGMDWLEQYSPMRVHWKQKWLDIPYQGTTICLQGLVPSLPEGSVIAVCTPVLDEQQTVVDTLQPEMRQLLLQYRDVFDKPTGLPPARPYDHTIPLIAGVTPVNIRPYRVPPAVKSEIERQVAEMLQSGVIQQSNSPFSSPVLLVKKKDSTWRFCVDFRHLNAITRKTCYPVPVIDELLDELASVSWFTSMDLTAGYHQIRLREGETHKTAFQTHSGHYEFRVMAFGLFGAPATFLLAMNTTLGPLLRKCVLVFFDDILIYSRTYEDHVRHQLILQLLRRDQWKVKLQKCSFAQREINYLGHVISEHGIATDPTKVAAVYDWPTPRTVKDLQSFLGLSGYYRKFIRNYGVIARPLNDLLKKGAVFIWTSIHANAFAVLKEALCSAPV